MNERREQMFKLYSGAIDLKWENADIKAAVKDAYNQGWFDALGFTI